MYDPLGRRISKKVQNQLTEYIYSGNDVIEETMTTVNPTSGVKVKKELREYVYGSKGMDDVISVTITPYTRVNKIDVAGSSNSYYYEKDHLGSITKITSSTGSVIDEYSYTVFGKAYKKNADGIYKLVSSLKSTIGNTRLYTGREYDRETGLYYHRARYYNPTTGRFLSRDPIGQNDQINLYTYVRNSPLMYTDRDGKKASRLLAPVMNFTQDFIGHEAGYIGAGLYHLADGVTFGYLDDYTGIQDSINNQSYSSKQHGTKPGFNRGWKAGSDASYLLDMAAGVYAGGQIATRYAVTKIPTAGQLFFQGTTYSDDVIRKSSRIDDLYHGFSPAVEKFATKFGKVENFIGGDKEAYQMLKMPGGVNDTNGVFEFIKDSSNQITHRFFRPN